MLTSCTNSVDIMSYYAITLMNQIYKQCFTVFYFMLSLEPFQQNNFFTLP
jgi:hypothetical protein